ncbi:MobA/MobL protein [Roseibium sp. TrichSKD4]|uniref:Ti-type conjugative transfer relaxase TraA n=1 Tax=Roseibium sp. TrichSKD4 TaxID=744980 RepID=UPI0001E576E4|nr:Ti-type conjugative transfer relaxase TraA [Roseibium sp. TrichSKD4]EFO28821.1 MobA/MobL protein [Roseibium sp. TrichSKD4]
MILKGSQRSGGVQLAHHLMNTHDNDRVAVHDVRGFMADNLLGAFKEAYAVAKGTRCTQYLFSLSLNPPEKARVSIAEFEAAISDIEQKLKLQNHPRAIVFHEKEGRRHAHVVWSRINPATMKAQRMSHFKSKLRDMSRELYLEHGWKLPDGYLDENNRDPLNYGYTEYHQAKRQNIDPKQLKALLLDCWQKSDSKSAFVNALVEHCLYLARGDRRGFVAVDHTGEVYSLSRWLDIKSKDLKARLGNQADLPSVAEVLAKLKAKQGNDYQSKITEAISPFSDDMAAFEAKREKLKRDFADHKTKMALRHKAELRDLYSQFSLHPKSRFQAKWQFVSGFTNKHREQIQSEIRNLKSRHTDEQHDLWDRHLASTRQLYKEKHHLLGRKSLADKLLRKELRSYFKHHTAELLPLKSADDNPDLRKELSERNAEILLNNSAFIPERLTDHQSVFRKRDIARELTKYIDDAHDFQTVLHGVLSENELVRLQEKGSSNSQEYFSTRSMIRTEREMMDGATTLYENKSHGVHPGFVSQAITEQNKELKTKFGGKLSTEQVVAIQHITGSERLSTLIGYAGAGKSTALEAAREAWEAQGYKVHGAALAGKAAEGLEKSSGIHSRTLHSYQYRWQHNMEKLNANDVFVIDEAGMVGSRQMNFFIQEVQKAGAKIVLVGDSGQLQPIAAGGAFTAISEITNPAKITEIRRQSQEWQREASHNYATGNIEAALKAYNDQGCVKTADSEASAMKALVKNYVADLNNNTSDQSSCLILAHRRKDVAKLNAEVRKSLISDGNIKDEQKYETANGSKKFATGDRILFKKNDSNLGVKNGTLGTVLKTNSHSITIQPDDKKAMPIVVDLESYNSLDHGYAVTIHKSQGATVDKTWLFATQTMDQHLMYVAGTRHKDKLEIFCKDDYENLSGKFHRSKNTTLEFQKAGINKYKRKQITRWHLY